MKMDFKKFKTVVISIGNTDDKLSQKEWHGYVDRVNMKIEHHIREIHFFGGSENWQPWQNVAWIIRAPDDNLLILKPILSRIGKEYDQDSVFWLEANAEFI